ncbi:MAG: peptidoglycan-binding domain-containing protein [Paracoccus sp. (in: a-proteobacteria)]|uniref:peptidoglycan-binding domain-containing protein n=1 Tax=Paracoccus sp. TaxID=267 RepID=UPI0026DEA73E|nr:peptidoglycan-binding domain-containing protein [Paracoccus sp. (in: a-proteobacteria)]MDO5614371.1 peptidoglycan-binding domain-containing protein [Paracoccus sp. (in: a-proteobacteria)]
MRRFGWIIMAGLAMPGVAMAEQVVIRVEAKRGETAAAQAAQNWGAQFGDVVTFPVPGGWTAIGLGPMERAEAQARLDELKAARQVPADSFIAPAPESVVAAAPVTAPADTAGGVAEPEPAPEPAPPADPNSHVIRLETVADRAEADAALARWRDTFPEAGMWELPNGRFAIAAGPLEPAIAAAWLEAFRAAGQAPRDAFLSDVAEMGRVAVAGTRPDLPAPPAAAASLPPVEDIQRALRWAGHYDGPIDGQSGPKTREAITREVAAQRLSPDPGTAMQMLIARREEWRNQVGLTELADAYTGLTVTAPMDHLAFDRSERALSIYGPKNESGAALILFSQPGGQQEMLDLGGLVTALGWVPAPTRDIARGRMVLDGRNDTHIGHAEGWVRDGRAEGYVLIWPLAAEDDQRRIMAEISDSFTRSGPGRNETALPQPQLADTPGSDSLNDPMPLPAGE